MIKKDKREKEIEHKLKLFDELSKTENSREEKLDDLIMLLEASDLNTEELETYSKKLDTIIEKKKQDKFEPFYEISSTENKSREELIDRFEFLLETTEFDSDEAMKVYNESKPKSFVKIIIGILFILLGFSMIILPAPKYFEMYTIFYFDSLESLGLNTYSLGLKGHGITVMDIISVIIIFFGIYIILSTKQKNRI